jgi:hypothetical protein
MNQAEAIEKISKALSQLSYQVAQENVAGFFSKNRLLEDLFLPVFSQIFESPALKNLNVPGKTSAFVDLADEDTRIGIQVTSENTASKIATTLRGIVDAQMYEKYARLPGVHISVNISVAICFVQIST